MTLTIWSGGQTGADRAALDAAIAAGVPHGGYVPRGRKAEDGRIPDRYRLTELPSADYPARTRRNVEETDATLIVWAGSVMGVGTALTGRICMAERKPCCEVNMDDPEQNDPAWVAQWVRDNVPDGGRLNCAGSRESGCPGIQARVTAFVGEVLALLA